MFGPLSDALSPDPSQGVPPAGGTVGMGAAFQAAADQVMSQQPVSQPSPASTPPPQPQPQPQQASAPSPRPILLDLIKGLIHPQAQNLAAARPTSRVDVLENFLGNFVSALGAGFSNEGRGPGAAMRGAGAAVGAPYQQSLQDYQLRQQSQLNQSELAQRQAQTQLTQAQLAGLPAEQQAKISAMTAQPRWDPNTKEYLGTMNDAGFQNYLKGQGAASVAARSKQAIAELGALANQGKVAFVKPAQGGGFAAYDKQGNLMHVLQGAIDPAQMQKVSTTQDFLPDGAGGWIVQPKTTVSGPAQPAAPLGQLQNKVPALGQNQTPQQQVQQKVPNLGAQSSPRRIVGQAVGVAFDPTSNSYIQETAAEAQAAGHQQFQKITLKESEENRQLNNRLTDVAQKISNYRESLNRPITNDDQLKLAALLGEDKWKLEAFGTSIPVDAFNKQMDAAKLNGLSGNAVQRMFAYYNARESMVGYQRVLSGGSKSNEKAMQLNLDALPSPILVPRVANEGLRQFQQNLITAGQGLPRMKGITSAADILGGQQAQQSPLPAPIQQLLTRPWTNQ